MGQNESQMETKKGLLESIVDAELPKTKTQSEILTYLKTKHRHYNHHVLLALFEEEFAAGIDNECF